MHQPLCRGDSPLGLGISPGLASLHTKMHQINISEHKVKIGMTLTKDGIDKYNWRTDLITWHIIPFKVLQDYTTNQTRSQKSRLKFK